MFPFSNTIMLRSIGIRGLMNNTQVSKQKSQLIINKFSPIIRPCNFYLFIKLSKNQFYKTLNTISYLCIRLKHVNPNSSTKVIHESKKILITIPTNNSIETPNITMNNITNISSYMITQRKRFPNLISLLTYITRWQVTIFRKSQLFTQDSHDWVNTMTRSTVPQLTINMTQKHIFHLASTVLPIFLLSNIIDHQSHYQSWIKSWI